MFSWIRTPRGAIFTAVAVALATAISAPIIIGGGGTPATPGTANVWVDTNGGSCLRQDTPGPYVDAAACGTFNNAFQAARVGETIRIRAGSYGDQNLVARTLVAPSINVRTDNGTVNFGVLNFQGADYLKFYGPFTGTEVRGNACVDDSTKCQRSRSVAWSGLTLNRGFQNEKAVDLMSNDVGWTFRDLDACCTHNDKIFNMDNYFNAGQTTDVVVEYSAVHSQTVDVNAGSGSDVHTECFWNLGPQSLVLRAVHSYGCNGTIVMNLSDTGDALVPANFMLENSIFEPPMNDDGEDTGCTAQVGPAHAFRGINFIRNNIFQRNFCYFDEVANRDVRWVNNVGAGPGCANDGNTYTSNRWLTDDCSPSDVLDANALAPSRYTDAPKTDAQRSNTQAGSQVKGNWIPLAGGAQINAGGSPFPLQDIIGATRPLGAAVDQGPYEFSAVAPGNKPPTGNFITPLAGTNAVFDAEPSIDPDGTIAEYRWDWDSDGTVDTTTAISSVTQTIALNAVVTLTVVDNNGAVSGQKIVKILA